MTENSLSRSLFSLTSCPLMRSSFCPYTHSFYPITRCSVPTPLFNKCCTHISIFLTFSEYFYIKSDSVLCNARRLRGQRLCLCWSWTISASSYSNLFSFLPIESSLSHLSFPLLSSPLWYVPSFLPSPFL